MRKIVKKEMYQCMEDWCGEYYHDYIERKEDGWRIHITDEYYVYEVSEDPGTLVIPDSDIHLDRVNINYMPCGCWIVGELEKMEVEWCETCDRQADMCKCENEEGIEGERIEGEGINGDAGRVDGTIRTTGED